MDLRITVLFVLALMFVGTEAPAPPGCKNAGVSGQRPPGCGGQIGKKDKLLNTLLERLLVRELEAEVAEEEQALKRKAMDNPQAPEARELDNEQAQELRDLDADEKQQEETRLLNLLLGLNGERDIKK
ncbi:uncharacterized protein [Antedon mediterranea]|uniref:uncharacterized protein n=1 Tax=Antedon mediterranea TaxID=105859 RepID=UPI003AF97BD4